MIRVRDYIFNENEIEYIKQDKDHLSLYFKRKKGVAYRCISNATFENIEWNYDKNNNIHEEYVISQLKEYENKIKELEENNKTFEDYNNDLNRQLDRLEEENKKLKFAMQDTYDSANDTCGELQQIIDKAIEYINDDLKDYQTISSGSANDLLKILKGEENESN